RRSRATCATSSRSSKPTRVRTRLRSRSVTRSSTRASLLVAVVALAAVVSILGLAIGSSWVAFAGLGVAIVGAAGFALHLIVTQPRRHGVAEEELSAQSTFLEALIESMGSIAAAHDPAAVLERARLEAKELFDAKATLLSPRDRGTDGAVVLPLRIRGEEIGGLQLVR